MHRRQSPMMPALILLGLAVATLGQMACGGGGSSNVNPAPGSKPSAAPLITSQPQSTAVTEGQQAFFSVTATGGGTLSYQWKKNSATIPGATSSSYTTPITSLADNGATFSVVVTNDNGSTPSNAATLTVNAVGNSSTYHLDAVNGNDATGDGSQAKPFKTFDKAMRVVASGDTVLMHNGDYGNLLAGRASTESYSLAVELFTNWVTFRAAPGETPHATTIDLGSLNYVDAQGKTVTLDIGNGQPEGNVNCYLRFEGLTVDDGVIIVGSRHVHIKNCTINRIGDLNGSVYNIEKKVGIESYYGANVTLEGNDHPPEPHLPRGIHGHNAPGQDGFHPG